MITVSSEANFKNVESYLLGMKAVKLFDDLERYGEIGVRALSQATPIETGLTSRSWDYRVIRDERWVGIEWFNTNDVDGTPVPILIQYSHATGTGGWVEGRDFINPAMRPVFEQIIAELREKVRS